MLLCPDSNSRPNPTAEGSFRATPARTLLPPQRQLLVSGWSEDARLCDRRGLRGGTGFAVVVRH